MRRSEMTYVVQMNGQCEVPDRERKGEKVVWAWFDVARVTVPAKTKRRTVIAKAVAECETLRAATESGVAVRVIPAADAEPVNVTLEVPPPRLQIGDR